MIDLPATITALASAIAAVGVILAAWWAYRAKERASEAADKITIIGSEVYELGKRVDGRLTELLTAQAQKHMAEEKVARAEGVRAGEQAQRDRAAEATK